MTHCEQTLSGTATTGDPTGRTDHPHLQQSDGYDTNHTNENRPANIGVKSNDCRLFQAIKFFSSLDALVSSEQIAEPRLTLMNDPRNLHPKEMV